MRVRLGIALVAVVALSSCGPADEKAEPAPTLKSIPLPRTTTPATTEPTAELSELPVVEPQKPAGVSKVLVFIEENHSLRQMSSGMPYAFSLAMRYGYATNFVATRHPSLPNYIAIAGGSTYGISSSADPSSNKPVRGESVFGQAIRAGKTAVTYADGMPNNCRTTNGGDKYGVRHNPWVYFISERELCNRFDVPVDRLGADITAGRLPHVGMVIPNNCNNAHDCSLGTADKWFQLWMERIFQGPDWKSGKLAVILTADEDDKKSGNVILTVVIHPSQKGNVVKTRLTHYSLSKLLSELTGSPPLINAKTAPSMSDAFGLPMP